MKTWNTTKLVLLLAASIYILPCSLYAQDTPNVVQLIRDSQRAIAAENFSEALRLSESAIKLDPAHPPAWRQHGVALWHSGKTEEAATAFKRAVEMDDKDTTALRGLALAYWKMEKHNEAARSLSAYLRLKPEDVSVWRDLAAWLTKLEKGDQAIAALERVVDLEPQNGSAWRELGSWQTKKKRYDKAVTALQKAVKLTQDNTSAWRDLATGLIKLERNKEAVDALRRVIEKNPADGSAWRDLASVLIRLDRNKEAMDALRKTVEIKPDDASAWHDLAVILTELNQHESAVQAFRKVTELKPDDAAAWHELAVALTRMNQHKPATEAYRKVVELEPENASAWREMGHSLVALKNRSEAIKAFRKTVELKPDDGSAWRELALLYQQNEELDEAVKAFRKALALRPDDPVIQRDFGWVLWKQGKRDEAVELLTKAVKGGLEARDSVIFQVVARLSEEGASDKALDFMHQVDPDKPPSVLGLKLARSSRIKAAGPILQHAWDNGEKTVEVGLYLAYAGAIDRESVNLNEYLDPLLKTSETCPAAYAEIALETLRLSSDQPDMPKLADRLEAILEKNKDYTMRITSILEKSADFHRIHSNPEQALHLYQRVIERDPERICWIWIVLLTEHIKGQTPFKWIDNYEKRVSDPALLAGVKGVRAERQGRNKEAVISLRKSIELKPEQTILRKVLFDSLLSQGLVKEARSETDWFKKQIEKGETVLRPNRAEMLTALGDWKDALTLWQMLYKANPTSVYYGTGTANVLCRLDRPNEAVDILSKLAETENDTRIFEMLAEITSARGQYAEAVEWVNRGLATTEKPYPGLLRYQAETLELMGTNAPVALNAAKEFLKEDPGNVPVTLLAARMMETVGATNELHDFHEKQLTRNPVFVPSLKAMRNLTTQNEHFEEAVEYARRRAKVQPENPRAWEDYGNSLAQNDDFRKSLALLRPLTKTRSSEILAIIGYTTPSTSPYKGRNSIDQISSHIKALSEKGYLFINSFSQVSTNAEIRQVMIVLVDPKPRFIEAFDPVLKQYDARVVYAGNAAVPGLTLSGQPIPERIRSILESGRWQLAASGPPGMVRHSINTSGVLGNPLTHPLVTEETRETEAEFIDRINRDLEISSQAIKNKDERILIYPYGDFGQRSLDVETNNLYSLHYAVTNHFTHAIYRAACGFYLPSEQNDTLRIPGRVILPSWDDKMLMEYLSYDHPLARAWLELGRTLFWHGQYEAAHRAFTKAELAGANPLELNMNWGMNAYHQGDLPTARKKLVAAQLLDPEDERILIALARLEDRRRPRANLHLYGWKDNEDRDYYRYGGYANMFVSERVRLGVFADRDRWKTDGVGSEYGTRVGISGLAYLMPQIWFTGKLWYLDMDDVDNHWGGEAGLRLPNPLLNGYITPMFIREEIETVEALRDDVDADTYMLRTYTRLVDIFDLYTDLRHIDRSDGNNTEMVDGRLLYRQQDWPYAAIGWRFRIADSDRDPPEYWAPEELQQHQLHVMMRNTWKRLSGFVAAEAGYAREKDRSWDFVWGARAQGTYMLTDRLNLEGLIGWSESPSYERLQGRIGITGEF